MEKRKNPADGMKKQKQKQKRTGQAAIAIIFLLVVLTAAAATLLYIRPDWRWLAADALFSSPAGTMPRGEDAEELRSRGGGFEELAPFTVRSLLDDPRAVQSHSLMLINTEHLLPADHAPALEALPNSELLADPQLCAAYAALAADVTERSGAEERLIVTSAYRTRAEQAEAIAEGGDAAQSLDASEHQAGLALDVCVRYYGGRSFLKTDAGRYVNSHAAGYGLIIRYPYWGKGDTGISFEPWHLRYVGAPHAALISENRMTLEKYISSLTPGLYFVSGEYLVTRQSDDAEFLLPQGFLSAEVSPDNTGYFIVTARLPSVGG